MSLPRLILVVALLIGGTTAAVLSYVESRRPVPRDPVAVDHPERSEMEHPDRLTPSVEPDQDTDQAAA